MSKLLKTPQARLAARALLAGVTVFVSTLEQGHGTIDGSLVKAAAAAGGWAILEYLTPLNAVVGKFKKP